MEPIPPPPPPTCRFCGHPIETATGLARGFCDACHLNTGLVGPVPELRPPVPCRRCNHTQLVRAVLRDRTATPGDWSVEHIAPTAITFSIDKKTSYFREQTTVKVKLDERFGMLVAHICRGCGFTEIYTAGFAELPIGPQYGTELIDVAPHGPDATPFR